MPFSSISISEADVFNALSLSLLNPTKATGIDDIGPRVLKHYAETLFRVFRPLHFFVTKAPPINSINSKLPYK